MPKTTRTTPRTPASATRNAKAAADLKRIAKRADVSPKDGRLTQTETDRVKGPAGPALAAAVNVAGRMDVWPNPGFDRVDTAKLKDTLKEIDHVARGVTANRHYKVPLATKGQEAFEAYEQSTRNKRK